MIPSRYRGIEKTQKEINKTLEQIKAEIRKKMKFDSFNEAIVSFDDINKIFDKYTLESEE